MKAGTYGEESLALARELGLKEQMENVLIQLCWPRIAQKKLGAAFEANHEAESVRQWAMAQGLPTNPLQPQSAVDYCCNFAMPAYHSFNERGALATLIWKRSACWFWIDPLQWHPAGRSQPGIQDRPSLIVFR